MTPERLEDAPDLQMVADRWTDSANWHIAPVTRFAPSPTGLLHAGHHLHLEWLNTVSAAIGAKVLVRMEDHDQTRCKPEYESAILLELDRLGYQFDGESRRSLLAPGERSPFRQSDNPERYQTAFDTLLSAGQLYGCSCTRGEIGPPDETGERRYRGTCRGKPVTGRPGEAVRVMLPDVETEVEDLLLGPIRQRPLRDHGDPVVRDKLGQWSYQLSVVVDDIHDGVNLIVRGTDLMASTGRQALLAQLLGRKSEFVTVHHPLLLDADGKKISKRNVTAGR